MKTIEESVVTAMDGSEREIFPFLPYILQDFWEIGTSPEIIINLVKKHAKNFSRLKVLDLGCGKGAVSVKLAHEIKCNCLGIDAIKEFIDDANKKAEEYKVDSLCRFEVGDIRLKVKELSDYDIIILGAIGPVFGNYYETLTTVTNCLKNEGLIIIDDGYIEGSSTFNHPLMLRKQELLQQIKMANMQLVDEVTGNQLEGIENGYEQEFDYIKSRCKELIEKYPEKASLFKNYMDNQREEYDVLESKVICSAMVITKNKTSYTIVSK